MRKHALAFLVTLLLTASAAAQVPSVINVEIDYMVTTKHSHEPPQVVLDAVVQMFACHGITLNLVVDEPISETAVIRCNSTSENFFTCFGPNSFATLKAAHAGLGALPGWHYAIFGHDYDAGNGTGSSGRAEIGGNDFLVTLGSFANEVGTLFDRAGTLAHELGHNLGLRHFSPASIGVTGPYSPNYASVMSYQYQLSGVRSRMECLGLASSAHLFKDLDYSNGRLPTLVESALDEAVGVGIRTTDWTCDGALTLGTSSRDLDDAAAWCGQAFGTTFLDDWNDWQNLQDAASKRSVHADGPMPSVSCITRDEQERMDRWIDVWGPDGVIEPSGCWGGGNQPFLVVEPCVPGQMIWVDDSNPGGFLGTGDDPFGSLATALSVAPDASVLYLQAGSYTGGGGILRIDRPLTLAGSGTAVVAP